MTRSTVGRKGDLLPRHGFSRRSTPKRRGLPIPDIGSWWVDHRGLAVWSTLVDAEAPDGDGVIPQWHLSISAGHNRGQAVRRVSAIELRHALECFGIDSFEVDNHHPGVAIHVWIPLDAERRVECECKTDEMIVVEADGYTWTTPSPSGPAGVANTNR